MLKGFKEFISQGNALELAVAVIIGAAFKPIVDAITKVILDIIGQVVGKPNFDSVGQFKIFASSEDYIHLHTLISRSRPGSGPRSAYFRLEIGRTPHRDRSTSASRSVHLRAILGNRAARRPLRITTASTIP